MFGSLGWVAMDSESYHSLVEVSVFGHAGWEAACKARACLESVDYLRIVLRCCRRLVAFERLAQFVDVYFEDIWSVR